ncbi:hypothetical protein F511_34883 [Dorcoceras hygrometricum]|uniref:Dystroglycan-like n=1 Tax=Dorcoceras hygrometricum TaxID=472368 RepID=A0A2Z7B8J4_9LAMI|nr:hypothetical protein F511_34883 [Dorcoceras hygrometricum]
MDDATITQMFELIIATGLKDFLGCPAVYYEAALIEFFENGSVREDGVVVSTIRGINVEISEGMFATAFGLPTEGLTDVSDVPKDLVFDARSLFSESKEQVSISCFKKEMKIEYRLLHDILAKTLFVKVGSFDAVTCERFMIMTAITFDVKINWGSLLFGVLKAMVTPGSRQAKGYAIQICVVLSKVPGLELGESNPFPIHRVLTERTVHIFIHINEQIGMEKATGSTPVKKTVKKPVSKKRPAASETEVAPTAKKKRTTKGKPAAMALEAVPLQTIEPTADVPAELPLVPKRKSRKRRLVLEQEDDLVVDEPVEENATGVQETSTDVPVSEELPAADPDDIIEQILIQLDTATATQGDKIETWFDRAFDEEFATTEQENQYSEEEIDFDVAKTGEEARSSKHHPEELMSLDDLLIQISEDTMLPSVNAAEITKIRLGESINIQEPWTATVSQIIDLLSTAHSKSLEVLVTQQRENGLPIEQPCTSTYLDTSIGSGAVLAQFFSQAKSKFWVRPMVQIDGLWTLVQGPEFLRSSCKLSLFVNKRQVPTSVVVEDFVPHGCLIEPFQYWGAASSLIKTWGWARVCTDVVSISRAKSSPEIDSDSSDGSTVYCSPSPPDDSFTLGPVVSPTAQEENLYFVDIPESPPRPLLSQDSTSSSSDSQMNFDDTDTAAPAPTISQPGFSTASPDITEAIHQLRTSLDRISNQDNGAALKDVIILHLHDIEKKFTTRLDAQDRCKTAADILSLSIQIGELVDHIRGGDAKKGEIGSSSRRPPPVCVERRPLSTQANQGESSSGHGRVPSVEEAAEMVREAYRQADRREREREREKSLRRLRRRGH